jgi:glycolate oxidase iron-sulfur subunit
LHLKRQAALKNLDPSLSIVKNQGCCGALHAHNGELEQGQEMAKKLGKDLNGKIVTTSAGCAAHIASVIGQRAQSLNSLSIGVHLTRL